MYELDRDRRRKNAFRRPADDFRCQAFMGACVGAIINVVIGWVEHDGEGDIRQLLTEGLSVLADGP